MIGIIGGSGLERLFDEAEWLTIDTPYGKVPFASSKISGLSVFFIPRHGVKHEYPPHKVNYKANLYALKKLGVDKVIATSAVGSLLPNLKPGTLVIVDQFIDFTRRSATFYDEHVVHVDMTNPYCRFMNKVLYEVGKGLDLNIVLGGTYVCTEGPRFETPAEINMFRILGATVVGMTNVPEVVLAREIALHYSLVSIVTNYAAGMQERVTQEEVVRVMNMRINDVKELIKNAVQRLEGVSVDDDCVMYQESALKYVLR